MKIVFTPICGSFEESYQSKKAFENINKMLEYIINYHKSVLEHQTIKNQYFIEWYAYNNKLKTDRFIIIFKPYKINAEKYPIGFFHYEE